MRILVSLVRLQMGSTATPSRDVPKTRVTFAVVAHTSEPQRCDGTVSCRGWYGPGWLLKSVSETGCKAPTHFTAAQWYPPLRLVACRTARDEQRMESAASSGCCPCQVRLECQVQPLNERASCRLLVHFAAHELTCPRRRRVREIRFRLLCICRGVHFTKFWPASKSFREFCCLCIIYRIYVAMSH